MKRSYPLAELTEKGTEVAEIIPPRLRVLGRSCVSTMHPAMQLWPGSPYPLGATYDGAGVNFALFSEHATAVHLCLFDAADAPMEQLCVPLTERTDRVWHGYMPGAKPGQLYGFRVHLQPTVDQPVIREESESAQDSLSMLSLQRLDHVLINTGLRLDLGRLVLASYDPKIAP